MHATDSPFARKRVLVTGGFGLIGSAIVRRLVAAGAEVCVIDAMYRDMGGHPLNLEGLEGRFEFLPEDYAGLASWPSVLAHCDCVFHLAGQTSHMGSMRDPHRDLRDNQTGFLRLLEACREHAPGARLVLASTRQIYGRPERLPVDETHPVNPPDINAVHNIAAEHYVRVFARKWGLGATVLRLTNTYGPGMRIKDANQTFVGIWIRRVLEGRGFEVWGKDVLRDFTYVEDCAQAFLAAAASRAAIGRTYNLGGERPYSLGEVADLLVAANGGGAFEVLEMPEERRRIDIGDFFSDTSLIARELGWRPATPLGEGLKSSLDWFAPRLQDYLS